MASPILGWDKVLYKKEFTTTVGTPQTVFSIPVVENSTLLIDINIFGFATDGNFYLAYYNFSNVFWRFPSGNVARAWADFYYGSRESQGPAGSLLSGSRTDIPNQAADIFVQGLDGQTWEWDCTCQYKIFTR